MHRETVSMQTLCLQLHDTLREWQTHEEEEEEGSEQKEKPGQTVLLNCSWFLERTEELMSHPQCITSS